MAKGKRAGARPKRRLRPGIVLLIVGVTLAVVGWGYLVFAAIDFGSDARGGDNRAWGYLALAALGAMACLFVALLFIARLVQTLAAPRAVIPPPPADFADDHRHRAD